MTDFTKEFIAEARESITEPGVERYICIPVQLEMLDEIERLQSRIAELEALVNVSEGLYERIYEQAARIAELEAENDRLQGAWFKDETICPDGSLKPKVSTLLSRIAELENEHNVWLIGASNAVKNLEARIAELEAEIDQLTAHDATERQDDKWIPVGERLPEDTERMLTIVYDAFEDTTAISILQHYGDGDWFSWDSGRYVVTHWMPLPELPKECER